MKRRFSGGIFFNRKFSLSAFEPHIRFQLLLLEEKRKVRGTKPMEETTGRAKNEDYDSGFSGIPLL